MYLISVSTFLTLDRLLPHQTLRHRGLLVERTDAHDGNVLFISHQWLGWEEPDPHNEQLRILQQLLLRLLAGEVSAESDIIAQLVGLGGRMRVKAVDFAAALPNAYIWMDYISMPQKLTGGVGQEEVGMNAIRSIPAYIEHSTLIMVLVPPATHKDVQDSRGGSTVCDYKTWRTRGWCRMEYVAAVLSKRDVPLIVVRGAEGLPEFMFPLDALTLGAGEGQFTCCARGHDFGNGPVACDKVAIRIVIEAMLDDKILHLHSMNEVAEARWFTAMRPWLLRGLPADVLEESHSRAQPGLGVSAVDRLKQRMRWRDDATEAEWMDRTGLTLLWLAAASDDLASARQLLQVKARTIDVNAADRVGSALLGEPKGCTPLNVAMGFS